MLSSFSSESKIQENKDWNESIRKQVIASGGVDSESKIQENKDWNIIFLALVSTSSAMLGEQDPRKQGLKLVFACFGCKLHQTRRARSKKTRIETRTKCQIRAFGDPSESKIQENKDWNMMALGIHRHYEGSESKIQENKDWNSSGSDEKEKRLSLGEQDPRKQGLKLYRFPRRIQDYSTRRARSKKTRIETKNMLMCGHLIQPRRARSKKTRIETWGLQWLAHLLAQLGEQDPRKQGLKRFSARPNPLQPPPRRARSKKTRIETRIVNGTPQEVGNSESKIQENKDWNYSQAL